MDAKGKVLMDKSLPNNVELIVAAPRRFGTVRACAIESCCGAANLAKELHGRDWNVSLAHPGFVARMKQNPDKTDFADARILADLIRIGYLPKVWRAPDEIIELRRLARYRQQIVDQKRATKLRIRALLRDERIVLPEACGSPWTKTWLQAVRNLTQLGETSRWILDQHLDELEHQTNRLREAEKRLEDLVADDAVVIKLRTFAGIGLITAAVMRAEIGEFDRFVSGKQLSKFCGVTPRNASSGLRQADAGLLKAGNPLLRVVVIEAAHRLMRYDERWQRLGASLKRAGKPTSVAVAAVANRWMRWLFHQLQPAALVA
jgi:transposase